MTTVLLSTDAVGGVWRYSLELARGLSARGARTVLAVLGPPPDPTQRSEAAGIPGLALHVLGLPLDWTAADPDELSASAIRLAHLAWRVQADTVQLHSPALIGPAIWPVPVIVTAHSCVATWWRAVRHGPLPPDLSWRAAEAAKGLAAADAVIAPSAAFAAALRDCYGLDRQIQVVANGRRPMHADTPRRPVAFTAGRLWDEAKGVAILDAAAARFPGKVRAAGPTVGPNGARLEPRNLTLCGRLDEPALAREYAGAAVFVSPSRYEPFGLSVLEAAQAGCALLLADIPTFRELWGQAAVFVPPGDAGALAAALARLLEDRAGCARLGAQARTRAAAFSPARMAEQTWTVHRAALRLEAA
jgi:glycosyltransferase involved in cell wall biosynthesis